MNPFAPPLPHNPGYRAPYSGFHHPRHARRDHGRRAPYIFAYDTYFPYFSGYPFGWSPDFDSDDDSDFEAQQQDQNPQFQPGPWDQTAGEMPEQYAQQSAPPPAEPPENVEPERPAYQGQQVRTQPATTLIFSDGRPSEKVHNYILTQTTLYNLDGGTRREIPLSTIDLPATIKANRSAGVDFSLPANR